MSTTNSTITHRPMQDLVGKTFGDLYVLVYIGKAKWFCRCNCGKYTAKPTTHHLTNGDTDCCGVGHGREPHGLSRLPEYQVWAKMRERCSNPKIHNYKNYGGRGIKVCERWAKSFVSFYEDMGSRPTPKHQINRINNDGDYSPENCRWATTKEQSRNRSNQRLLTYRNMTMCLADWAEFAGVNSELISSRLKLGWTLHEAVTIPPYERRKGTS